MGNSQVFQHRLPALSAAFFVTLALALSYGAAFTCSFLKVTNSNFHAVPSSHAGDTHYGGTTTDHNAVPGSFGIGLLCESPFYSRSEDRMWIISRIMIILALVVGTVSALLGWAISTFVRPTNTNWHILSTLSALSGLIQVPAFFLFDSKPCTAFEGQSCGLSVGCSLLICSTFCYACVLVITQMFERPLWAEVQDMWKVNQKRGGLGLMDDDSIDDHDRDLLAAEGGIKTNDQSRQQHPPMRKIEKNGPWWKRWWIRKGHMNHLNHACVTIEEDADEDSEVKGNTTVYDQRHVTVPTSDKKKPNTGTVEGTSHAIMNNPDYNKNGSEYAQSIELRLTMNVGPNGRILGDDSKSNGTFSGDLDEDIRLAEIERQGQLHNNNLLSVSSASSAKSSSADLQPVELVKLSPCTGSLATNSVTPSVNSGMDELSSHEASANSPAQFSPAVHAANGIAIYSNPRSMSFSTMQMTDNLRREFSQDTDTAEGSENRRNSSISCPPLVSPSIDDKKASLRDAASSIVPWRRTSPKRNRDGQASPQINQQYELFEDVDSSSAATSREEVVNLWASIDQRESQVRLVIDSAYDDDDGVIPPPPPLPPKKTLLATESKEEEDVNALDKLYSPEGDWDVLREAAIAGAIAALESNDMGSDPDPEPQYYSSDESTSTLSLSSFHSKQSDSESSTCTDNTSSESEGDDLLAGSPSGSPTSSRRSGSKRLRTPRKKRSRRSRQISASGSACSNSLLDTTINEETDRDLEMEFGSGEEDNYESNTQLTDNDDGFNLIMGELIMDYTNQGKFLSSGTKNAISSNNSPSKKSREARLSKSSAHEEGYLSRHLNTSLVSPSPSRVSSALRKAKQNSQRKEKYVSMEDIECEDSVVRALFAASISPRKANDSPSADDDGIEGSRDSGDDERQISRGARPRKTRTHSKSSRRGRSQVVPVVFSEADEDTGLNVGSDEVSPGSAHYPVIKVPSNSSSWRERKMIQSGVHYDDSEAVVSDHSGEGSGRSSRSRSLVIRDARKRRLQIQRQHSVDSLRLCTTSPKTVNVVRDYGSDEASL